MAIQGLRDSSNFQTNQRPENWRETILRLMPNSAEAAKAPLTALTSQMKTRSIDDSVYHSWEKSVQTRRVALGASLTAPAAGSIQNITVTSGAKGFKEGDLLLVEDALRTGGTPEILQVYSDPASDTVLAVVRGAASTTPAAVTYNGAGVNPNLVCIGSAFEEGSLAPTGVAWDPSEVYNYLQIFRSTLELTRTAMKTKLRTNGKAKDEAKREALETMGMDLERAFWFGKRSLSVKNNKPVRTFNGIYSLIPAANKLTPAAPTSGVELDEIEEFMFKIFKYGSSEKMFFTGNRALLAIQQAVRKNTAYTIYRGEKEFGMAVTRITSPFGDLVCKSHPLFNQMSGGTTSATAYYGMEAAGFVLDMSNIGYVHLTDSDITYEDELEAPGMDGVKEGYIGEVGIEVNLADTHFFIYGLNSGKVDT